ncbi:MAG: hypothetical protein NTX76_04770 [Alphaproteobacteria bacterium]|nr:hypothetical protein [Alphaproteobacteria bacterium]
MIKERLELFHSLYDPIERFIIIVDKMGSIVAANKLAIQKLQKSEDDLLKTELHQLAITSQKEIQAYLRVCYSTTQFVPGTLILKYDNDKTLDLRTYGNRYKFPKAKDTPDANQDNQSYVIIRAIKKQDAISSYAFLREKLNNETSEKIKKYNLVQQKKLAAVNDTLLQKNETHEFTEYCKTWFLSRLLQDFHLPINKIYERCKELSRLTGSDSSSVTNNFESLYGYIKEILALVGTMEETLKDEKAPIIIEESIDLQEAAADVVHSFCAEHGIKEDDIELVDHPNFPWLRANKKIIQKIITMCLGCLQDLRMPGMPLAIEFRLSSSGKGVISLSMGESQSSISYLQSHNESILTKNYETKMDKKINSALLLSKKLMAAHGGKLICSVQRDQGASISLIFPEDRLIGVSCPINRSGFGESHFDMARATN